MVDPDWTPKEESRISLPYQLVNEIVSLLSELPAKTSMNLILAIQQEAEVVE